MGQCVSWCGPRVPSRMLWRRGASAQSFWSVSYGSSSYGHVLAAGVSHRHGPCSLVVFHRLAQVCTRAVCYHGLLLCSQSASTVIELELRSV